MPGQTPVTGLPGANLSHTVKGLGFRVSVSVAKGATCVAYLVWVGVGIVF